MNVKKMFAGTAGMLLLAQMVLPVAASTSVSYGEELTGAYLYAYDNSITTIDSIEKANMYGQITRGQLAKMISNWAKNALGRTADETKVCNFPDANTAEGDLAMYVKMSCQMGLMGQGVKEFRPNAKVTRGEFGTTLSRALWGTKYDTTATPYYKLHLQALKEAGIMTKIENPNQLELRGYVMLMLQRADVKEVDNNKCSDPVVVLACTLGTENCPANCKTTVNPETNTGKNTNISDVKAGDLGISLNSTSGVTSIPNEGVVKVATMDITSTQDIALYSMDVTRLGLSNNEGLKVWVEKDGRRVSSSSSFFGDSKASLVFNGGYTVKKGEKLDLVISMDQGKVDQGSELSFKVSNVASSAKNVIISPDTTGIYRTTTYSVTSLTLSNVNTSKRIYNVSKDAIFTFGQFKVQNDSSASMEKNVLIKSFTFKVDGADVDNLNNFKILRDGKELKSTYVVEGRTLTIALNDQLDSGRSATYKVIATPTDIENENGDTYTLKIQRPQDIVAEEIGLNSVGYRVFVKGTPVNLGSTTIKGGNITLARDTKFPSVVNADWGYSDVVIAKGTIKVAQAVKFEDGIVLSGDSANIKLSGNNLKNAIRRASITIGGRKYQASSIDGTEIKFGSEVYLQKGTHDVEVTVSLVNSEPTGTPANPNFELHNLGKASFKNGSYLNNDETGFQKAQIVGNLRIAKVNVQAQKISFKKQGPAENVKLVKGTTDEKVIFAGEITNSSDKTLEINQFELTPSVKVIATGDTKLADVAVYLDNGTVSSTVATKYQTPTQGSFTIDSVTTTIEPGKTLKFELKAINNADLLATESYRFAVKAKGMLEGNVVETTNLNTVWVEVKASATTTVIGSSSTKNTIVLPGTSTEVASFNYNVRNDSVDIDTIEFTGKNIGVNDLDDMTIKFDNITPAVDTITVAGDKVTVKLANVLTLPVNNYTVRVLANFSDLAVNDKVKTLNYVSINNNTSVLGTGSLNYSHRVAKAYPILAVKEKNTNSGNERLDINVTKSSNDYKVVLDEILWSGTFNKVSGTYGEFKDVDLSATVAEVARSTDQKAYITWVNFTVTDDYGISVSYTGVDASNIADFAALSL